MAECMYQQRLMAYHDGELTPQQRLEVERHVKDCLTCGAALRQQRALSGLVREAEAIPTVSEDALARLHRAIPAARERSVMRICRAVALAAAVLLVFCIGSLWYETRWREEAPSPPTDWEMAAVTVESDGAHLAADTRFAAWVVSDLSRENER
jgi:anti-sigma factor RsiW